MILTQWRREFLVLRALIISAPPLPPFLLKVVVKVAPLNPARGFGESPAANDFGAFWVPKTLLMTSKMCIVLCTWFVLPCPSPPQRSSHNFVQSVTQNNYRTPFRRPSPLAPGGICPYLPTVLTEDVKVKSKVFCTHYRASGPVLIPVYRQSDYKWLLKSPQR